MKRTVLACTFVAISTAAAADLFPVTANAAFTFNGQDFVISRDSVVDTDTITQLASVSTCASPCLSPMVVANGVATIGEIEVIAFLSSAVEAGDGLLVDARSPVARSIGFIPASVNVPAATLSPANPYRDEILMALGAEKFQGIFNFENATTLTVFDGGPATSDAQDLITDLLDLGYPAEKLTYYRGGMQVWATLGLTIQTARQ